MGIADLAALALILTAVVALVAQSLVIVGPVGTESLKDNPVE